MKNNLLFFSLILSINVNAQWQQTNFPNSAIWINTIVTSGNNIFTGTLNGVYRSTDNGSNWSSSGLSNMNVSRISINGSNIYAGTTSNGLFLSTNNGASWSSINSGLTSNNIQAIVFKGSDIFTALGSNKGVFLSSNNGNSWVEVNTGLTNKSINALAINGNNIFAGTYGGGVFMSPDNGNSWDTVNTGLTNKKIIRLAVSGANIFATTENGIFLSSNNGGNWSAANTGVQAISGIYALTGNSSNVFCADGYAVYLFDNVNNWVNVGMLSGIESISMNSTTIFAAGDTIKVWKRPLSQIFTGIKENIDDNFHFNIYPNPTINKFTVSSLNQSYFVTIFNLLGTEIYKTRVNNYQSEIEISNQPGIYFVQMESEENKIIKKMILE